MPASAPSWRRVDFDLRTGTAVTALRQGPGSVTVETAEGTALRGDVVVVCAGPASLGLVDAPTAAAAPPSLPQVAYFAPRAPGAVPPVFIEWGDDMLYGLPVPGGGPHAGTYKVSHHTPGPPLQAFDPSDPAPLGRDDPALLSHLTDAVARLLPSLDPEPVATERCVYDNSADSDFVLDRVGRVVVGCGTSGHAFKFGPLLGELLADLAEGRRPEVDLARFSLRRGAARQRRVTGGVPVGCAGAPLCGPAPERQRRRPRPRRHGRAARRLRRLGVHRRHDVHPDGERPLLDGVPERAGHRHGH